MTYAIIFAVLVVLGFAVAMHKAQKDINCELDHDLEFAQPACSILPNRFQYDTRWFHDCCKFDKKMVAPSRIVAAIEEAIGMRETMLHYSIRKFTRTLSKKGMNVLGTYIGGGAVANTMLYMAGRLEEHVVNDVDIYVFVTRFGLRESLLNAHKVGNYKDVVTYENGYGELCQEEVMKDKCYKVQRSIAQDKLNFIICTAWDNKLPTAAELAADFDLNICQAAISLRRMELGITVKFDNVVSGYDHNVEVVRWHSPVQSTIRAMKKSLELGFGFGFSSGMSALFEHHTHHCKIHGTQLFGKKYAELYEQYYELHEYFTIERDIQWSECYVAKWNKGYELRQLRNLADRFFMLNEKNYAFDPSIKLTFEEKQFLPDPPEEIILDI